MLSDITSVETAARIAVLFYPLSLRKQTQIVNLITSILSAKNPSYIIELLYWFTPILFNNAVTSTNIIYTYDPFNIVIATCKVKVSIKFQCEILQDLEKLFTFLAKPLSEIIVTWLC